MCIDLHFDHNVIKTKSPKKKTNKKNAVGEKLTNQSQNEQIPSKSLTCEALYLQKKQKQKE